MDENNRNFVLALVLSVMVLAGWQYFFVRPQMEQAERQQQEQQAQQKATPAQPAQPGNVPQPGQASQPGGVPQPGIPQPGQVVQQSASGTPAPVAAPLIIPREIALSASPKRIAIDTPDLRGSIALKGARIDDLILKRFKETVRGDSPQVTLLSPSGSADPYYAEYGWTVPASETSVKVPTPDTLWKAESNKPLTSTSPVTLSYDNGEGLIFRRTIAVDEHYMFTVTQEVENKSGKPVTLFPFSLLSRHGEPTTAGFVILHEGLIGVMGDENLQEFKYSAVKDKRTVTFKDKKEGWLGFTDKYWGTSLIPNQNANYTAYLQYFPPANAGARETFQTLFMLNSITVAPGSKQSATSMLFAGAKENTLIDAYKEKYQIRLFDRMIDWGWFPFITKPLFLALTFFYHLVGNFGLAILIVTVIVKGVFFPLQNKSYASMTKMKKLQPEIKRLQERYGDDRMKQQQVMMELYKKEKVNPMAGCLPILIQIPVFFALYKVIYVSIEMRHAPFFGWIQDLSAPDPTSIFNLFGLIPWSPPAALMIGVWPIIMGVTMWVQMKLNPSAPDPMQQKIFDWMPVFFTYLLCAFPAGLVIYWTWNNLLSIAQQWLIMHKQGVEVNLLENMGFGKKGGAARKGSLAE